MLRDKEKQILFYSYMNNVTKSCTHLESYATVRFHWPGSGDDIDGHKPDSHWQFKADYSDIKST